MGLKTGPLLSQRRRMLVLNYSGDHEVKGCYSSEIQLGESVAVTY